MIGIILTTTIINSSINNMDNTHKIYCSPTIVKEQIYNIDEKESTQITVYKKDSKEISNYNDIIYSHNCKTEMNEMNSREKLIVIGVVIFTVLLTLATIFIFGAKNI